MDHSLSIHLLKNILVSSDMFWPLWIKLLQTFMWRFGCERKFSSPNGWSQPRFHTTFSTHDSLDSSCWWCFPAVPCFWWPWEFSGGLGRCWQVFWDCAPFGVCLVFFSWPDWGYVILLFIKDLNDGYQASIGDSIKSENNGWPPTG